MDCAKFRNIVNDLLREEGLDAATMETALAHAESCNECNAMLEEAESLSASLRSLAARHSSDEAPPSVEKALLATFAQKRAPAPARAGAGRFWIAGVAGSAAAAVLLIFLLAHRGGTKPNSSAEPQTAAVAPEAAAVAKAAAAATDSTYELDDDNPDYGNVADSFVPLSPEYDLSSLDDGTIVRVVLSQSAMESFGLPPSEAGNGQVVADLVITNDGIPRAIRVVGW